MEAVLWVLDALFFVVKAYIIYCAVVFLMFGFPLGILTWLDRQDEKKWREQI